MSDAMVTALAGVLVCVISNLFTNMHTRNLIVYRIEQLEKKVEKHNQVIERTFNLETHDKIHEEQIHLLQNDVKELKGRVKNA